MSDQPVPGLPKAVTPRTVTSCHACDSLVSSTKQRWGLGPRGIVVGACALLMGWSTSTEPEIPRVDRVLEVSSNSIEFSDFEIVVPEGDVVSQTDCDESFNQGDVRRSIL